MGFPRSTSYSLAFASVFWECPAFKHPEHPTPPPPPPPSSAELQSIAFPRLRGRRASIAFASRRVDRRARGKLRRSIEWIRGDGGDPKRGRLPPGRGQPRGAGAPRLGGPRHLSEQAASKSPWMAEGIARPRCLGLLVSGGLRVEMGASLVFEAAGHDFCTGLGGQVRNSWMFPLACHLRGEALIVVTGWGWEGCRNLTTSCSKPVKGPQRLACELCAACVRL